MAPFFSRMGVWAQQECGCKVASRARSRATHQQRGLVFLGDLQRRRRFVKTAHRGMACFPVWATHVHMTRKQCRKRIQSPAPAAPPHSRPSAAQVLGKPPEASGPPSLPSSAQRGSGFRSPFGQPTLLLCGGCLTCMRCACPVPAPYRHPGRPRFRTCL
eukprot:360716-Chlamydomonas_euryale.AAC.5